jgi:hypothetical protein
MKILLTLLSIITLLSSCTVVPAGHQPAFPAQNGIMESQQYSSWEKVDNGHQGYMVQERDLVTNQPIGKPFWVSGENGPTLNGKEFRKNQREHFDDKTVDAIIARLSGNNPTN